MRSDLSPDDVNFVSSLLIRAGLWVSHCENTDPSGKSEIKEKTRMIRALQRIEKNATVAIVSETASRALANIQKPLEPETRENLSSDLSLAAGILKSQADPAALNQYSKAVMYVAKSVARAYREELDHHEDEFMLENILNKFAGSLNKDSDPEEYRNQNISPAEDSELTMIAKALRT